VRRKTPPDVNPARLDRQKPESGLDGIAPPAVLGLGRRHCQTHLFAQRSADESTHGMRLPSGSFHQFLHSGAAPSFQQFEDRLGLGAFADPFVLGRPAAVAGAGAFAPLGAFFAGLAFLPDLPFFFATCAPCGATRAFLVAFGSAATLAGADSVCSAIMMFSLSAVITARSRHGSLRLARKASGF
jgi:hypothetical protein